MEITGRITSITPLEEVGDAKLKKQTVVIEDAESKNQAAIDFLGENTSHVVQVQEWDIATIKFAMRVNFAGKFFNRISGSLITKHTDDMDA